MCSGEALNTGLTFVRWFYRLIENEYLGLNNGILDQSAILLSRERQLTVIDCLSRSYRCAPLPPRAPEGAEACRSGAGPPFKVLLVFSGATAALAASSSYNGEHGPWILLGNFCLNRCILHLVQAVYRSAARQRAYWARRWGSNVKHRDLDGHHFCETYQRRCFSLTARCSVSPVVLFLCARQRIHQQWRESTDRLPRPFGIDQRLTGQLVGQ